MEPQHPNRQGELAPGRSTIGSYYEPDHAIRDGADAGEPIAAAVRVTRLEWRRRRQRSPEIVTGRLPEQPIGNAGEQVVNRHLVAAALGRLTQEHRDVLRECHFLGSSVAQAAHALGIAPSTVKSRTYYALRALRLAIEELRDAE
jgi:DNA-directed RNA polymerase specialized sigma24 family protein